ncbi:MAG: histidine kinase dimerization/phospho-acceptor domain-containing protein, partial [Acidobacteriota bacterium]
GGAWAFLPVVNAGQTLACLILRGSGAHILSRQSLEPVREALPIVALSLKASRLQAELQAGVDERTGELSALYEVSRSLGFVLAVEDLFQLVCEALRRSVHCDLCAFTLYMPGRREMSIRAGPAAGEAAVRAFSRDVLKHLGKPAGRGPGEVAVHVSRTDPSDAEPPEAGAQPLRSTVHAPLQLRGEIVGQLSMGSCGAGKFTATNRRLLQTIASQAALTLDRLRTAREAETSRIHSMLESMAEGVLLLDRDLKIMMLNPAAEAHLTAITGASPGPALESLGEIDMRSMIRDRQEPGSRTRPFEVEDSSGTRAFSVTCSPVRDASASVDGMVVVISDITEARRLQAHLAQSEKLSALGEMISGVAHELNNPLASVMGNAELLQEQEASESVRRKVLAIRKEAQRCRKIVSNLLHFSRGHAPEHGPVDINAGIQAVLQLLEHQLKVDSVKVDVDLEQALNAVMGDSHLLQQVFLNIVFNAYQAMQEKVGPGRLTIRSRNGRHRVVVEISDNGPGIPPAILKKIFDPFFSTKEVGRGTG